jgi:CheY-like chemotaxis protein
LINVDSSYFDAIIFDYRMPIMSGFEFLQKVKEIEFIGKKPKLILVTGDINLDNDVLTKEYKVDKILLKPVCGGLIKQLIRDIFATEK